MRSYKIRGAYNFIAGLPPEALAVGVVCASAGNHAQGVAWSCRHLGVRGAVFLPQRTPRQKVARIRALAGDLVDLHFAGESFDDALAAAAAYATGDRRHRRAHLRPSRHHRRPGHHRARDASSSSAPPPTSWSSPWAGAGSSRAWPSSSTGSGPAPRSWGSSPPGHRPWCGRSRRDGSSPSTSRTTSSTAPWCAPPASSPSPSCATSCTHIEVVEEGRVCTEQLDLYQVDGIVAEPAGALGHRRPRRHGLGRGRAGPWCAS